jgi:hypothetical protein
MHAVSSWGEEFTSDSSIRSGSGVSTVYQVGCTGEDGEPCFGITVQGLLGELFVKSRACSDGERVHPIVVITKLWDLPGWVTFAESYHPSSLQIG